nr:MFS transporter [uncultured Holophaga sp.]
MKHRLGLKLTILSISLLLMARMTISTALAEIARAFPHQSQADLMNMVALPSLVAIPFTVLSGFLSNRMSKKAIVLAGLVLFILGGVGPMFLTDFTLIMFSRALLGAGTGLFLPMSAGLFDDFFTGNERNFLVGMQSASVGIGNIITSLLAGVLATLSWRLSFLIYALGALVLVAVIFKLPEPPRSAAASEGKATFNGRLLLALVCSLLYAVLYFAFYGFLAFIIEGRHMGNAAAAGIGIVSMTLGSILAGAAFGFTLRKLRHFMLPIGLLLNMIGFLVMALAGTLPALLAGAFALGLGFGLVMPYACMVCMDAAGKGNGTLATGLFMTALSLGTAVSPLILELIGKLAHNHDGQFIFRLCAYAFLATTAVSIVMALRPKGKRAEVAPLGA